MITIASKVDVNVQNVFHLHPKTLPLGLAGEKILGLSGCNARASVWTESGKVGRE